jgi:hypothetical protein
MSRMKRKIVRDGILGRKTLLLSVAAIVAALASLASLAGPAQAYNTGSCFGYGYGISDVDQFKMSSGRVDFGDGWHLGGSPLWDAVVCWGEEGSINIRGKLYNDSPTLFMAAIDIRYFHTDGSYWTSPKEYGWGKNGQYLPINHQMPGATTVDRVRIRLWDCGTSGTCQLANAETFHRGDVNIQ